MAQDLAGRHATTTPIGTDAVASVENYASRVEQRAEKATHGTRKACFVPLVAPDSV